MLCADVAYCKGLGLAVAARAGRGEGLEVYGVPACQLGRKDRLGGIGVGIGLCSHVHGLVAFFTLRHDNIEHIIFETVRD